MKKQTKKIVYCLEWTESESGWGQRPDGYSLHLNMNQVAKYCEAYWEHMPKDRVPEVYSREEGKPYLVFVDTKTFNTLKKTRKHGLRFLSNATPQKVTDKDVFASINER